MPDGLVISPAHALGKTCLAFSRDGTTIYTGGCDSLVRVWDANSGVDQEPDTAVDAEETVTCLVSDSKGWLSGSEDANVRRYSHKSTQILNIVIRNLGFPIRCIAADPKGRRVAVISDDIKVRLVDLDDTDKVTDLVGHTKPVRKATWHPSGTILTTCALDGNIIVWDVAEEEPKQIKILEGILPAGLEIDSPVDYSALWHPSGNYFVVTNRVNDVITISRSTWSQASTFSSDAYSGETTALCLSINGVYLATACKSGVFVWATATRRVILHHPLSEDTNVDQLAFSPTENLLVWTDNQGSLCRWRKVIPNGAPDPVKLLSTALSSAGASIAVRRDASPLFGNDDADTLASKNHAEGGDLDDANLDYGLDAEAADDEWIIDDLDGGMQDAVDMEKIGLREMVSVTKAQVAFQPGSTPFINKRRYLGFNNIGVIEAIDQDTHYTINVEFFDQTTRKSYHFTDHAKSDLAAIGERGIVYASPPEKGHSAQIKYKPYATWSSQSDWTYDLPLGEKVVAVAAGGNPPRSAFRSQTDLSLEGDGYVAVATDNGIIRVFSGGGMQRGPVWAIDGDVVAMVGGRDYIFVVHREGGTSLDGNQNLKYTLRTTDSFRILHTGRIPVNKGHILKWIGVSDEGAPVIYDSAERLMMLEHYRYTAQGCWSVLLDTKNLDRRKGKDESYWPIGVSNNTYMCIILKGRESYPGFPRPLAQELEIKLPYLNLDSSEAQKEERFTRETILLDQIRDTLDENTLTTEEISKKEVELDKEIIQLVQFSCKQDQLQRALDAVKLLHHTMSFDMATKVADFYHFSGLAEKIKLLKEERLKIDRLRDDRNQRVSWKNAASVVRSSENYSSGQNGSSPHLFQDTTAAPPVNRPGLTPATVLQDPSPFSRKAPRSAMTNGTMYADSSRSDGKRKRDTNIQGDDHLSKRLVIDENDSTRASDKTNQPKPNPFAHKAGETAGNTNNPFLRKLAPTKSLNKSESFFNKVNAAEEESDINKNESKSKKPKTSTNNTKQTTLLGFGPGKTKESSSMRSNPEESQETVIADENIIGDKASQNQSQFLNSRPNEESQTPTIVADDDPIDWPPSPSQMED